MSEFPALILFLFPLAYSPGPGNLFFAASGARFGFRATLPASAGYHLATWGLTAAIGIGFAEVAAMSDRLMHVIRIAGGLYVLYLAYGFLGTVITTDAPEPRRAGLRDGAVILIMNPKAWVIIALMLTQFVRAEGQPSAARPDNRNHLHRQQPDRLLPLHIRGQPACLPVPRRGQRPSVECRVWRGSGRDRDLDDVGVIRTIQRRFFAAIYRKG